VPIICPACNKANQTAAICARCVCDLGMLYSVAHAAEAARPAFHATSALGYSRHALKWHARASAGV
jgi:hypothetical protein